MKTQLTQTKKTQQKIEGPMLKFLQAKGVKFNTRDHVSYTMKHCDERSTHSSRTCIHGFMDLAVETFVEEFFKISVCHYQEQNGDLMADPEIVYRVVKIGENTFEAIPEYYKQNNLGVEQFVYGEDGKTWKPALSKSLKQFTKKWVKNLQENMNSCEKDDF